MSQAIVFTITIEFGLFFNYVDIDGFTGNNSRSFKIILNEEKLKVV